MADEELTPQEPITDPIADEIKLYPGFEDANDMLLELQIADAREVVASYHFPKTVVDKAVRLYAMHLLTVQSMTGSNGYQSETMGPLSHTKFDWSNGNDPFIQAFNDLLERYGLSKRKGRVWTID